MNEIEEVDLTPDLEGYSKKEIEDIRKEVEEEIRKEEERKAKGKEKVRKIVVGLEAENLKKKGKVESIERYDREEMMQEKREGKRKDVPRDGKADLDSILFGTGANGQEGSEKRRKISKERNAVTTNLLDSFLVKKFRINFDFLMTRWKHYSQPRNSHRRKGLRKRRKLPRWKQKKRKMQSKISGPT